MYNECGPVSNNMIWKFAPLLLHDLNQQKAQALLGQMLMEGYGCEADPARGREMSEKARRRGYRMQGVYCEIWKRV